MSHWFTSIFLPTEKVDWRLCAQVDVKYITTYTNDLGLAQPEKTKRGCIMTFFLYEDQNGNRKFDIVDSEEGDVNIKTLKKNDYAYRCKEYRKIIRPWLDGRLDPDIPTYESIPRRDFKRALSKKK